MDFFMRNSNKSQKENLSKDKVSVRGNDDKNREAVRVSNLDTLRFSDFNIFFDIYMRLLNTARHWDLLNDYLIEIIAKSKSTPRVGITQLVKLTTEVNYLLIQEVNQRWDELPAEAQQLLEELDQLQLRYLDKLGEWGSYSIKNQLLLLWVSIRKGKDLLANYRVSALRFVNVVLGAYDRIILSDTDRDIFLQALENPPELPEDLKLGIERFRKKYKI